MIHNQKYGSMDLLLELLLYRAAVGAAAGAAASAAAVCIYYVSLGGALRAPLDVRDKVHTCLLYTSPSPRDRQKSRMPSSA